MKSNAPEAQPILQSGINRNTVRPTYGDDYRPLQPFVIMQPEAASRPEPPWIMTVLLVVLNISFFACGVFGASVVYVEQSLEAFSVCTSCKHAIVESVGCASGYFAVVGLVGCFALWARNRCVNALYYVMQLVLFVVFVAWTGSIVATLAGAFDSYFADGWNDEVQNHAPVICNLQNHLHCSGWDKSCAVGPHTALPAGCANCTDIANNAFPTTCHGLLEGDLHTYYMYLLTAGIFGMMISVICIVLTSKLRKKY